MLSKEQKEKLRKIHIYKLASKEKNGVAITRKEEDFAVPSTYEIAESVFKLILDCGFSKVERVSPRDANCIVRVFQKLHHKYEFGMVFNMYGADVFVKDFTKWTTEWEGSAEYFTLDYEKCIFGQWLYPDEKVIFNAQFVDFYVKVS